VHDRRRERAPLSQPQVRGDRLRDGFGRSVLAGPEPVDDRQDLLVRREPEVLRVPRVATENQAVGAACLAIEIAGLLHDRRPAGHRLELGEDRDRHALLLEVLVRAPHLRLVFGKAAPLESVGERRHGRLPQWQQVVARVRVEV
jgi:hypothetical protein